MGPTRFGPARSCPIRSSLEIVERRPLALWQHQKKFALIDEEGAVILRNDVGAFSQLMVVVGEDAASKAAALVQMLATEPDLDAEGESGCKGRRPALECAFANGLDVKLPEDHPEAAWRRLGEYQRRYGVLDKPIRTLDLRLSDRLMIMPAPPSTERNSSDGGA